MCMFLWQTGQTLLHFACALGQLEIVIYLLNRRDCNVSEQDEVRVTNTQPALKIVTTSLSLSLSLSHTHTHTLSLSLSLYRSLTHCSLPHSFFSPSFPLPLPSLSLPLVSSLSLSLSLTPSPSPSFPRYMDTLPCMWPACTTRAGLLPNY